ncbi:MAG: maleate cis-trans isomerase, partial [Geminicoccaceae bacterium]
AGYDARLIREIEAATGLPTTTTTTAVLRALEVLGVSRISLATPYTDEVNALEVKFFEDHGFSVLAHEGGGIVETADIQACRPEVAYERARRVDHPDAQAVFISCTGFRTAEVIAALEADLGKPVISANQATFADCLRILRVRDVAPGHGRLLDAHLLYDFQPKTDAPRAVA